MKAVRNILIVTLYIASSTLSAGTMGPVCERGGVTVPCDNTGWGVGVQGLYLRNNVSGLNYIGSTYDVTTTSSREHFVAKKYKYAGAFKLEAFYNFNTGRDLNLNWYHFNHTTPQALPSPINVHDTSFGGDVNLRLKSQWDAVNLEYGQLIDISKFGNIRFHGGLQFADLVINNTTTATAVFNDWGKRRVNHSDYRGVGARVGTDLMFNMQHGFALYSNFAAALLTGRHHFKREAITYIMGGAETFFDQNHGSAYATVPELEAKLGATYTGLVQNYNWQITAGWAWFNYFDAIETADSGHHGRTKESNFSEQGPFVGLRVMGN